mmetsp:Transcript_141306/g.352377  ORF Transcript_141306/g.352377 Transcript_141306/m.352377 type:complete len:203 (-) Transcript_141306:285-893(-)
MLLMLENNSDSCVWLASGTRTAADSVAKLRIASQTLDSSTWFDPTDSRNFSVMVRMSEDNSWLTSTCPFPNKKIASFMTFRISARTGAKSTELAPFSTDKTSTSLTFWISARIGATSMGCTSRMADKTGAKSTPDLTLCISATIRAKSDESASRRVDNIPVQATSGLILLTSAVNLERVRSGSWIVLQVLARAASIRFWLSS